MKEEISTDAAMIDGTSEQTHGQKAHISTGDALHKLEHAGEVRSILLFEHGTLQIKMYTPRGPNGELIDPHLGDVLRAGRRRREPGLPSDLIAASNLFG